MKQERGCGAGGGMLLLGMGILLLVIFMPFIGLPVGLVAATVAILAALGRRRRGGER